MSRIDRRRLVFSVFLVIEFLAAPAFAEELAYTVTRDGDEIGEHRISLDRQGDRIAIDVETDLAVKIAFVTVFRFEHERQESWVDGNLVMLEGKTNDDGEDYLVSIARTDSGYRWTVNGSSQDLTPPMMTASLWNKAVIGSSRLYSAVSDKVYQVSGALVEKETLETSQGPTEAEHYRISGELERDLWYDAEGRLLRVVFESRGSEIEYRLK